MAHLPLFETWHETCLVFLTYRLENQVADNTDIKKQGRVSRAATVVASSAAVGASWMALVAATTIGLGHLDRVRAEVSADLSAPGDSGRYRLVVQSYARDSVDVGNLPRTHQKPLASAQRSVTAEELSRGVAVDVLRLGEAIDPSQVIVAWIERGEANLEFDGAEARPSPTALIGMSESRDVGPARVVLKARA
jgi:hypothetical protein